MRLPILQFTLLVVSFSASPQSNIAAYQTHEVPNGRAWLRADESMKAGIVIGYEEAVMVTAHLSVETNQTAEEAKAYAGRLYPIGVTREETMKFLDAFFSQPENRLLAIGDAIHIFALKMLGRPNSEIEADLAVFRALAAKEH